MDATVVAQKLESLRRCLVRIETKCPTDPAQLEADFDLQDIVSLNLSRAVQLCVDIGAHLIAGMSMNKLVEQLSAHALAAWDTENHFRALAATGDVRQALAVLDRLDGQDAARGQ